METGFEQQMNEAPVFDDTLLETVNRGEFNFGTERLGQKVLFYFLERNPTSAEVKAGYDRKIVTEMCYLWDDALPVDHFTGNYKGIYPIYKSVRNN